MGKSEQVEAARNIVTGAIVLIDDSNRKVTLAKPHMQATTAVRDESGEWVDSDPKGSLGGALVSGSLVRIGESLASLDAQRQQLIDAAARIEGGSEFLESRGFIEPAAKSPEPKKEKEKEKAPEPPPKKEKRKAPEPDDGI